MNRKFFMSFSREDAEEEESWRRAGDQNGGRTRMMNAGDNLLQSTDMLCIVYSKNRA